MNKTQQATIKEYADAYDKAINAEDIANILGDLQDKYDGMSEKAQENEKGQALQSEITRLEELVTAIEALTEAFNAVYGE